MAGLDEIAELEAERDRILSMIAYHNSGFYSKPSEARQEWSNAFAIAAVCVFGALCVAGLFSMGLFAVGILVSAGVALLAYFFTRKVTLFGVTFQVGEALLLAPNGRPAGEPETLQRLAHCEARIAKLKESSSQ
jgi:nitrate reductase NapE component